MSFQHFKSLLFRASKIQEEIEKEHRRYVPDWIRLLKLKKLRLMIKDKMHQMLHENDFRIYAQNFEPARIRSKRKNTHNN